MKKIKLSFDEIERARDRILQEYDHYIVQFLKSGKLKSDFEDRYLSALKARIDMASFLHAELITIKGLHRKEEERLNQENNRAVDNAVKNHAKPKQSFADRIILQNHEKIKKYPDSEIHPEASFEVRKLFGAVNEFERRYWPDVERCMRMVSPTLYSGPRVVLGQRIFDLWSDAKGGLSPRLAVYEGMFSRFPRNVRDIEREEQRYLVDSGHLLHELVDEMKKMTGNDILERKDRNYLEKTVEYVHTVIDDFRLNDFKIQK